MSAEMSNLSLGAPLSAPCAEELHCMRINGRKIFGPPANWIGDQPPNTCELFVKGVPKDMNEYELLSHFQRFGKIYEFRLMIDFNNCNRGFGYVRYIREEDAKIAAEVLNHLYVRPFKTMGLQKSYDKCRLFVGHIPKHLTLQQIENDLRHLFPEVSEIVQQDQGAFLDPNQHNRGFVLMNFRNHNAAIRAKQISATGRCRIWDRDIKIVWANPERWTASLDDEVKKDKQRLNYLKLINVYLSHRLKRCTYAT